MAQTLSARLLILSFGAVALAACGEGVRAPEPAAWTLDPTDAVVAEESIIVPDRVVADEPFEVNYKESVDREKVYDLYRDAGTVWEARYQLIPAGASTDHEPRWITAGQEVNIPSVGTTGTGPDVLVVPAEADPGPYVLCVREAVDPPRTRCARLEIVEP